MSEIINKINELLAPGEKVLKTYKKYIGYFLLLLSICSFGFFWVENAVKESGEKAIFVLWIILWIPIFARVFGMRLFSIMLSLRQELGILMGMLAFVHGMMYIGPYPDMIGESYFWLDNTTVISYLAVGFITLMLTIPLTLTSNKWSMRLMGRYWKWLHKTVYVIIIFAVIHVVLINFSKHMEWGPLVVLILYFGFKILEWRGISFAKKIPKKTSLKGQKWLCVPCGYIYDPVIGNEADGIKPGTDFSDIPDDWKCPECGVTKADFIPYEDGQESSNSYEATVVEKTLLNPVTLKLVIELVDDLQSRPGQFVTFVWSDSEGEFNRSYSIAEHDGKKLTFLIKLTDLGRGASILRSIEPNTKIRIRGIFGNFVLQDTKSPKVFIATGTGISPIYNMIRSILVPVIPGLTRDPVESGGTGFLPPQEGQIPKVQLYFTVATGTELFYTEELKAIEGLDLHIHTTREQVSGYTYGRVNIDDIVATPDTQWYLCGSPKMVEEVKNKLALRGYNYIYSEEFN